ncbi:hypothetical protein RJ640_029435 [Escallonia rubra]|uniref:Pentatricopeptide repeat-containing protein n=1 Tax=Escallonia rubra TaxID=112253 RepID=A0AA88RRF3_9ASTE|nr:hypothetical protein RJ640_029435 [Escallonia rubra]
MNLWRLISLLNQPHYPRFKLYTPSLSFINPAVHIHTASIVSEDPQIPTVQISFNGAQNTTLTSLSYSKLLSECCKTKALLPGLQVHAHIIKSGLFVDPKLLNHLINLYAKCRVFGYARKLLDEIPEPDLVAWSALVSEYVQNGLAEDALLAFRQMQLLGVKCNEFTFPSVLKACSVKKELVSGRQVHGIVVVTGFDSDVFVANTLVVMYAKCGEFLDSRRLFDQIPERNIVSWNALLSSYTQSDYCWEAVVVFFQDMVGSGITPDEFSLSTILNACTGLGDIGLGKKIHGYLVKLGYGSDPFSSNALVDMYAKVGDAEDAITVFEHIPLPDIVSWNAVIAGCVQHENHDRALKLLGLMKRSGICPNMFTLSSALKACAGLRFQELGRQLHCSLIKMDVELDPFTCVGLIDMYCKCGLVEDARMICDLMPEKDLIALNALVCGLSQNRKDIEALKLFTEMYKEGKGFNETTLLAVLNSSASFQAVDVCKQVHTLSVKYGFLSDIYVINSLIDSYGKCSQVEDAARVFEECPTGDLAAFTSLIACYAQYGRGEEALKL